MNPRMMMTSLVPFFGCVVLASLAFFVLVSDSIRFHQDVTPDREEENQIQTHPSDVTSPGVRIAAGANYPGSGYEETLNSEANCRCDCSKGNNPRQLDKNHLTGTLGVSELLSGALTRKKPLYYYNDVLQFADYAERARVSCPQMRYMGGHWMPKVGQRDGEKAVCFSPVYNITPGNCIVYSFGVANDFSFEDAMAGYGCQIYSFDPTIKTPSHNRSGGVHFYNIGVASQDKVEVVNGTQMTYKSLPSIMQMLGHTHKVIDYVKFDIEASEIELLQKLSETPQMLLQIKQLGIEVHPIQFLHHEVYELFVLLEYLGFTTFDARRNPVQELWYALPTHPELVLSQCYELAWAQVDAIYW